MIFRFEEIPDGYAQGMEELLVNRGHSCCRGTETDAEVTVRVEEIPGSSICVEYRAEENTEGSKGSVVLRAPEKAFACRALMTLVRQLENKGCGTDYSHRETAWLERNGVMLDCSRNSVLTVETIKKYIRLLAALGMNTLMLYTEDTYEVPQYPYFGAWRGRYERRELEELADYAQLFGIEMIPCIQALAHLKNVLRWPAMEGLQDTDDILMADEDAVYDFLRECIRNASAPFHTRRIHLGMDEAWSLGLGKYLHKNGYHTRAEIMSRHLERVTAICRELGLEPMIWSDMYLRMNSAHNEYYDVPLDSDLSGAVRPPEGVTLVYWDYYHEDSEFYRQYIRMHHQLSGQMIFAGGGWVWNGTAPNLRLAERTTDAAMCACREAGVKEAVCTMWQDDGAETPMAAGLTSIVRFAEHGFSDKTPEEERLREQFEFLTRTSYEAFLMLGDFDGVPGGAEYDNPSKYLLYQDVLLGLFDGQIQNWDASEYYGKLRDRLMGLRRDVTVSDADRVLELYIQLADLLSVKADMGKRLYAAYREGSREEIGRLAVQELPVCIKKLEAYHACREDIWNRESRIFGYEVLDIRLGGLKTRLESAQKRLLAWASGQLERLPELEEARLAHRPLQPGDPHVLTGCNSWKQIVSASPV